MRWLNILYLSILKSFILRLYFEHRDIKYFTGKFCERTQENFIAEQFAFHYLHLEVDNLCFLTLLLCYVFNSILLYISFYPALITYFIFRVIHNAVVLLSFSFWVIIDLLLRTLGKKLIVIYTDHSLFRGLVLFVSFS